MYHTYTTNAFVVEQYQSGEVDIVCVLYTEDFGLLRAKAQGLRNESSKLRYSLQTQHLSSVSLVRGHSQWRIVGASRLREEEVLHKALFARVLKLVSRLVKGEEKDTNLFAILVDAYTTVTLPELPKHTELLIVCKVLIALGYVSKGILPEGDDSVLSEAVASFMMMHRSAILKSVNDALLHSHL